MYNNYNFISSEIIIAEVKQELSSYFDSGSLTETLMPSMIDNALRKLKVMVLQYEEDIIPVDNYRAKLPANLSLVKDAFLCTAIKDVTNPVMTTKYEYYKKIYCNDTCGNEYETFSQETQTIPSWIVTHMAPTLLRVYYTSRAYCSDDCNGLNSEAPEIVRINGRTLSASFSEGNIYLQYYSRPEDDFGPLIPELVEVEEYIKAALYYNLFKVLYNSVTDESVNIIERKLMMYKQEYYAKYEAALNMLKLNTKQQLRDSITKQRRRFMKFMIN